MARHPRTVRSPPTPLRLPSSRPLPDALPGLPAQRLSRLLALQGRAKAAACHVPHDQHEEAALRMGGRAQGP